MQYVAEVCGAIQGLSLVLRLHVTVHTPSYIHLFQWWQWQLYWPFCVWVACITYITSYMHACITFVAELQVLSPNYQRRLFCVGERRFMRCAMAGNQEWTSFMSRSPAARVRTHDIFALMSADGGVDTLCLGIGLCSKLINQCTINGWIHGCEYMFIMPWILMINNKIH